MDFLGIGFSELMFILIIAMMVFGPKRLPELASKAGKMIRDLRGMSQGLMAEWQRELNVSVRLDELKEIRYELEETKKALSMAKKDIEDEASAASKVANEAAKSTEEAVKSMTKPLDEKPRATSTARQLPESPSEPEPETVLGHENGNGSVAPVVGDDTTVRETAPVEGTVPEPVIDARLAVDSRQISQPTTVNENAEANDVAPEATSTEAKETVNE